jgi:hypothetical protein
VEIPDDRPANADGSINSFFSLTDIKALQLSLRLAAAPPVPQLGRGCVGTKPLLRIPSPIPAAHIRGSSTFLAFLGEAHGPNCGEVSLYMAGFPCEVLLIPRGISGGYFITISSLGWRHGEIYAQGSSTCFNHHYPGIAARRHTF